VIDPGPITAAATVLAFAGAAAAAAAAVRLSRLHTLVGDKGFALAAAGLTVYAAALLLEALGNLVSHPWTAGAPDSGGPPGDVAAIIVNRGTLLALPLYMVSYTLIASANYVSLSEYRTELAALPLVLLLYIDLNTLSIILLAIAAYLVAARYGWAGKTHVAFYTALAASHTLPILAALDPVNLLWTIPASTIIRATAPLLLALPR